MFYASITVSIISLLLISLRRESNSAYRYHQFYYTLICALQKTGAHNGNARSTELAGAAQIFLPKIDEERDEARRVSRCQTLANCITNGDSLLHTDYLHFQRSGNFISGSFFCIKNHNLARSEHSNYKKFFVSSSNIFQFGRI